MASIFLVSVAFIGLITLLTIEANRSFLWKEQAWTAADGNHCPENYRRPIPLLLLSFDGFRSDFLLLNKTPSLQILIENGVRAEYLRPMFPTNTYPNLLSISTGLYPEYHGVVNNLIFDPELGYLNIPNYYYDTFYWKGEPIWNTARLQGRTSATVNWFGSDAEISDSDTSKRSADVDTILSLLTSKEGKHDFVAVYYNQPDAAAHIHGAESIEVNNSLSVIDQVIHRLMAGLLDRNLLGCINIVIVADHGHQTTSCDRLLLKSQLMQKLPNLKDILISMNNFVSYWLTNPNTSKEVISEVVRYLDCLSPFMLTLSKDDFPARIHYYNHKRIPLAMSLLQPGSQIKSSYPRNCLNVGSDHGYDTIYPSMQTIFIAYGPSFKKNLTVEPFENIELYNLFCELLNVTAAPNNGTTGALYHMLKNPPSLGPPPKAVFYTPSFPGRKEKRARRRKASCPCIQKVRKKIRNTHSRRHLPWGIPYHKEKQIVLPNMDYITSYDITTKQPRWTAFLLTSKRKKRITRPACWRGDLRLAQNIIATCSRDFQIKKLRGHFLTIEPLFHPSYSKSSKADAYLLTNAVIMYKEFRLEIFDVLRKQIELWLRKFKKLFVILGPIFDSKSNMSSVPLPVPSDFFVILYRCTNNWLPNCSVDSLAFILPHRKHRSACQSAKQFLELYIARIRDIELKTGLEFFISNQTLGLRQRLKLGVELWGGLSVTPDREESYKVS